MEKEVKEETIEYIRHALAVRDSEMKGDDLYLLFLNGFKGYDHLNNEEVIDQYICMESLRDVLLVVKNNSDSDWCIKVDINEDGEYQFL